MLGGLVRLVLFRILGARVLLAITAFGWLRKVLAGRRDKDRDLAASRGQTAATGTERRT